MKDRDKAFCLHAGSSTVKQKCFVVDNFISPPFVVVIHPCLAASSRLPMLDEFLAALHTLQTAPHLLLEVLEDLLHRVLAFVFLART